MAIIQVIHSLKALCNKNIVPFIVCITLKYYKERRLFIMKKYKVFVNGVYVGSTYLTPAQVSKLNNDTSIILSRN